MVSSVNSAATKYIACENVQEHRVEIIQDFKEMAIVRWLDYSSTGSKLICNFAQRLLNLTKLYMKNEEKVASVPTRLIFFRGE